MTGVRPVDVRRLRQLRALWLVIAVAGAVVAVLAVSGVAAVWWAAPLAAVMIPAGLVQGAELDRELEKIGA